MAAILCEKDLDGLDPSMRRWAYNALDTIITERVAGVLEPQLQADPRLVRHHDMQLACCAPSLAMTLRGLCIDEAALRDAIAETTSLMDQQAVILTRLAAPFWDSVEHKATRCGKQENGRHKWPRGAEAADKKCELCGEPWLTMADFNANSHPQVRELVYGKFKLPRQFEHKSHKVSVAEECLDRLRTVIPKLPKRLVYADRDTMVAIIDAILGVRDYRKQLGTLKTKRDSDGRWRYSMNVGADVTGRWSSNSSPFWTGANIQNIADRSRGIFASDPGLAFFYADYEQAESRVIAYDAEDEAYIAAHESGDVHTEVTRLVWPAAQEWTGDLKEDRKLADLRASFDPHHELRWYAKHIAHGSAIGMTEHGIARDAHISVASARTAQMEFFRRFPRVRQRQGEIWDEVKSTGRLYTPLGRMRQFMGRMYGSSEDSTRRQALAQIQQSMIADWVSIACLLVWSTLDGHVVPGVAPKPSDPNRVWLLAQVHDALLGEVRIGDNDALEQILELMNLSMEVRKRTLRIPVEIKVGLSWKKKDMLTWQPGFEWPKAWR